MGTCPDGHKPPTLNFSTFTGPDHVVREPTQDFEKNLMSLVPLKEDFSIVSPALEIENRDLTRT